MFYSAKMEGAPPTKSELEAEISKLSKGSVTPPPSDSDQSSDKPTSEPVFIKAPGLGIVEQTPAVRIVISKPVAMTGIFPLTRIELGDVWTDDEDIMKIAINMELFSCSWDFMISHRDLTNKMVIFMGHII